MSSSAQNAAQYGGIQSTAGAIPVRNEKGEISMQKVKVMRYISGKRPEYATYNSSDEESDDDDFIDNQKLRKGINKLELLPEKEKQTDEGEAGEEEEMDDPRLRRLQNLQMNAEELENERHERHRRHIHDPEILDEDDDDEEEEDSDNNMGLDRLEDIEKDDSRTRKIRLGGSDSESDGELSDSEIEKRRQLLRFKMLQQQKEEEILVKEDEQSESSASESESEEEEDDESDVEDNEPRLKPLFVRKRDRTTIIEKEKEDQKKKQAEYEQKKMAKERRRQTLRLVEESVKKDLEKVKSDSNEPNLNDVCTDDENDEVEYEAWKLRELKRIKRDRDEKEAQEREKLEVDRLRNLTEEERRQELRLNPKEVTNKATKGKYKFLQKYYHRGAFYLDEENDVFKRDFSEATLEDHFDKSVLPKVMQVKNFGRCGRTKYTHLTDQDTTDFKSPWYHDTATNLKFHHEKAGGTKQVFDKPCLSKRRKMN